MRLFQFLKFEPRAQFTSVKIVYREVTFIEFVVIIFLILSAISKSFVFLTMRRSH